MVQGVLGCDVFLSCISRDVTGGKEGLRADMSGAMCYVSSVLATLLASIGSTDRSEELATLLASIGSTERSEELGNGAAIASIC
jgi:hypothetical protein